MAETMAGRVRALIAAQAMVLIARCAGLTDPALLASDTIVAASRPSNIGKEALAALILAMGCGPAAVVAWAVAAPLGLGIADIDRTGQLLLRLVLAFALLLGGTRLLAAHQDACARYWTTWWDPASAEPDGEPEWIDVLRMTQAGAGGDPLAHRSRLRRRYVRRQLFPHFLLVGAVVTLLLIAVELLLVWRMPASIVGSGAGARQLAALANASGNLTAYLALLAAAVSIVFTYHQLRSKVRADNRQAWIDRLRRRLARIIADARSGVAPKPSVLARRVELELMLNPSEKDHRLLLHLLRRLAPDVSSHDPGAGGDLRRAVAAELGRSTAPGAAALIGVLDEDDPDALARSIVRLSHVLLKREWERVRAHPLIGTMRR